VVLARSVHGLLTHRFYDPQQQGWTPWVDLGNGQISSAPSAVMADDRLTVLHELHTGRLPTSSTILNSKRGRTGSIWAMGRSPQHPPLWWLTTG